MLCGSNAVKTKMLLVPLGYYGGKCCSSYLHCLSRSARIPNLKTACTREPSSIAALVRRVSALVSVSMLRDLSSYRSWPCERVGSSMHERGIHPHILVAMMRMLERDVLAAVIGAGKLEAK